MKAWLVWWGIGVLSWANLVLAQDATSDVTLGQPTVRIASQEGKSFDSLQKALDAAPPGAIVHLGAGRFNERVAIKRPVTLVGAGTDQTILGPTEKEQLECWDELVRLAGEIQDTMRAAEEANPRRSLTPEETEKVGRDYKELERLKKLSRQPVVLIEGVEGVVLRSLRVTMPLTPCEGNGLPVTAAVKVKNSGVLLAEMAIVGCMADGVDAEGGSKLEVVDSLIAACWGSGISGRGEMTIRGSDIRNNYHYNIWVGAGPCVIEGCRITGTAWSGIRCGGAGTRIVRNVVSGNSRGIYSAGKNAVVKHNLFYRNGASCWSPSQPLYEGNLFFENDVHTIGVSGPAEPRFRNNLFVDSPIGVAYWPLKLPREVKPPATDFHLEGNVFWQVDQPVVVCRSHDDRTQDEALPVVGTNGNRIADPRAVIDDEQRLRIGNSEIVRELELADLQGLSLRSPWPLTAEELAMIPDDGTVHNSKWKKRPKLKF